MSPLNVSVQPRRRIEGDIAYLTTIGHRNTVLVLDKMELVSLMLAWTVMFAHWNLQIQSLYSKTNVHCGIIESYLEGLGKNTQSGI